MKQAKCLLQMITGLSFYLFPGVPLNAQGNYLETIKVTDSIYVFKPKIDWTHSNGIAIIGNDGVFFIDTYIQTNYAEEAIKRLRKVTRLPVKYVLNTHFHDDHVMGNYVFKKAFPECMIIAQDSTCPAMVRRVKPTIAGESKRIDDEIVQLERELRMGKTDNGDIVTSETMIKFWHWQLQEAKDYRKSYKGNQFVNADISFHDSLTFRWGSQTIQLIHASDNGHSRGDVIAWIPEKRLVIAGDIVVAPTPYATYRNIPGMIKSIQRIIDMNPSIIIPGHGAVEYDQQYLYLLKEAFTMYMNAAEKAIADKIPVREAMNTILFPEIDRKFTGGDDVKNWAYRSFFSRNVVVNMYRLRNVALN